MLHHKKSCYKRKKYLINKCRRVDNNIICFLDESLEKIKNFKKTKRISINKYLNNLYKYYCKRVNIEYEDIIDSKNNSSINEKIIDDIQSRSRKIATFPKNVSRNRLILQIM